MIYWFLLEEKTPPLGLAELLHAGEPLPEVSFLSEAVVVGG